MTRYAVIGAGWRAEFYLRIAAALPTEFEVTGIYIRNPMSRGKIAEKFGVRICGTLDELLDTGCDFVVSCVSWGGTCDMITELANRGIPVLTETPVGTSVEKIARFKQQIDSSWRVQVAEQFHLQPRLAAIKAVIDSGVIGDVHHVQLSLCHGYHAASLIRYFLDTGLEAPEITKIVLPEYGTRYNGRQGLTEPKQVEEKQVIAVLRFGNKSAVYDFTGSQYFSDIRGQRITVRGTKGEIVNDVCTYLDGNVPMQFTLTRDFCGANGNLDGLYLRAITGGGRVLYRNPFPEARLSDEEVAIAHCVKKMDEYLQSGVPFYSLESGMLDAEISLQI